MCTNITIKYDGGVVTARTNEFGVILKSNIFSMPRGSELNGFITESKGLKWKTKYGFVGIDGEVLSGKNVALDGFNEEGLSVQGLYFPGYAKYQETNDFKRAITNLTLPNYILSLFSCVEEVKEGIKDVVICGESFNSNIEPFHYQVNDKKGNAIVIEIIDGQVKIYDNKLGVMTNSPEFSFHETNFKNYINLSPYNIEKIDIDGFILYQTGQGSGQLGLPGDMTPTSRFIRAVFYQLCANKAKNKEEAIDTAFHILNSFDIVPGICRHKAQKEAIDSIGRDKLVLSKKEDICELTQVTIAKDLTNFELYYKDYFNMNIRKIDCKKIDLSEGAKPVKIDIYEGFMPKYNDVTDKLK